MRIILVRAGKKDTVSLPLIRITGSPQGSIQPFQGMGPQRFAAVDRSDPPIPDAVFVHSGEQQTAAIGRPDRIARIREGGLDPPRRSSLRGNDENLTLAQRGADILRSGEREEGDPLAVGRELRLPSVRGDERGRASRGGGMNVDTAAVPLGTIGDHPAIW